MSKTAIKRITNANVYVNGNSLLGKVDSIDLPDIKTIMEEHPALGLMGKPEFPSGIDKMEAKIRWNSFYEDAIGYSANPFQTVAMQVRQNRETYDSSGRSGQDAVVCFLTGQFKDQPLGKFKQHKNVELESSFSVQYVRLVIGGVEQLEVDILANIYKVQGVDQWATYRANIGG